MPILLGARHARQRPDGSALKKDQLIVQDLPVGRGQTHRAASGHADRMIGIQTNPFFTMSMSQTPCVFAGENDARAAIRCMRMVEPTGIEPATSSLQS